MDAITSLFDLDMSGFVPTMGGLTGFLKVFTFIALLIGPVLMLVFGYLYLKHPTAEANRKFGFRIFYGMGSVEAWQFTQRLAGLVFGGLGLVLTAVMLVVAIISMFQGLDTVGSTFMICMIIEAALTIIAYATVSIIVMRNFDAKGNRKR